MSVDRMGQLVHTAGTPMVFSSMLMKYLRRRQSLRGMSRFLAGEWLKVLEFNELVELVELGHLVFKGSGAAFGRHERAGDDFLVTAKIVLEAERNKEVRLPRPVDIAKFLQLAVLEQLCREGFIELSCVPSLLRYKSIGITVTEMGLAAGLQMKSLQ